MKKKFLFMKYNFIAIEGNIGSGKTSLASKIASDFNSELILESFSDNPFLPKFYKDPEKYSFSLELFFMSERYHQLKDKISSDLFFNNKISDYFFMKSRIFAKTNLQRDELLLFEKLFDIMLASLPAPDLLVYLHSDIKRLQSNIRKRGREYENSISIDYLSRLNERYEAWIHNYKKGALLIIDIDDLDFVENKDDLNKIIELIDKKIK